MPAVVSCPNCQRSFEYTEDELDRCKACGEELPEEVREAAHRTLRRKRPLLLTLLMALYGFTAAVGLLIVAMSVLGSGPYTVDGEPVSKAEFLRTTLSFLVPMILGAGVLAYALWKEKVWGRHMLLAVVAIALLAPILVPLAGGQTMEGWLGVLITSLLFIGFLAWYLYRKRTVVEYYAELEREHASGTDGSAPALQTG